MSQAYNQYQDFLLNKLIQEDRLINLGQMAAGLSHEIKKHCLFLLGI